MARTKVVVDPITRIEGHLRIEVQAEDGRIAEAWASSTQFRGIEIVMQGRDPRDAWAFTQRICGVCTVVHAIASCRAVEDAIGIQIPPNATTIRNLVHGMQTVQDHVVHFLTFGRVPDLDRDGRPLFAYGKRIHDQCQRRAHYDAGQFVEAFDDDAARRGWCLYKVGCKGPATFSPCPIIQWNRGTSWPVGAGHPCIGCTERNFWDTMTPFYRQMPDLLGIGVERTADTVGLSLAVGATAGVAAHAIATGVHRVRQRRQAERLQIQPREDPSEGGEDGQD